MNEATIDTMNKMGDLSPEVKKTLEEILNMSHQHGFPVGVSHAVFPSFETQTSVFFSDGYVLETNKLGIGEFEDGDVEKMSQVIGMKVILSMIPLLAPYIQDDYLMHIGKNKTEHKDKEDYTSQTFVFRAPQSYCTMLDSCEGSGTFKKMIQKLANDAQTEIIEGEW